MAFNLPTSPVSVVHNMTDQTHLHDPRWDDEQTALDDHDPEEANDGRD